MGDLECRIRHGSPAGHGDLDAGRRDRDLSLSLPLSFSCYAIYGMHPQRVSQDSGSRIQGPVLVRSSVSSGTKGPRIRTGLSGDPSRPRLDWDLEDSALYIAICCNQKQKGINSSFRPNPGRASRLHPSSGIASLFNQSPIAINAATALIYCIVFHSEA